MTEDRIPADFREGGKFVSDGVTIKESGIIHFALPYDPQPFPLDAIAAEKSLSGGMIASGFRTVPFCFGLCMRRGAP